MRTIKHIIIIVVLCLILTCCGSVKDKETSSMQKVNTSTNQQYLNKNQIMNNLSKETKIEKSKLMEKYIWFQYVDMDEDPELELLVSYRYDIHKGFFFIYNYENNKYKLIFSKPWAIERMSGHDIIVASGSSEIHQLEAKIIQMHNAQISVLWQGIIDRYDYSDLINGLEIHGQYYVDTNSKLHYFYKIEKTDKNASILDRQYKEELFIWDSAQNKFVN